MRRLTTLVLFAAAAFTVAAAEIDNVKTFSTIGKEQHVLSGGVEAELFRYSGKGCITHMWFLADSAEGFDIVDFRGRDGEGGFGRQTIREWSAYA